MFTCGKCGGDKQLLEGCYGITCGPCRKKERMLEEAFGILSPRHGELALDVVQRCLKKNVSVADNDTAEIVKDKVEKALNTITLSYLEY
jgi:hypothetical protein